MVTNRQSLNMINFYLFAIIVQLQLNRFPPNETNQHISSLILGSSLVCFISNLLSAD